MANHEMQMKDPTKRHSRLPYKSLAVGFLIAYLLVSSVTWAPSAEPTGRYASLFLLLATIASAVAAITVAAGQKRK